MGKHNTQTVDHIKNLNLQTYLKGPSYETIMIYIRKRLRLRTVRQFERFFGLPLGTVNQVKQGRDLPPRYWHLIYENIKPRYGVGLNKDLTLPVDKIEPTLKEYIPKEPQIIEPLALTEEKKEINNALLEKMKEKLS